jgi:hypothetical protein
MAFVKIGWQNRHWRIKEETLMSDPAATLVERLCAAKPPREMQDWESRDGYYVAACRVSKADVPGLVEIVRTWLDSDGPMVADETPIDLEEPELLPVTAWRTLADLKDDAAVEPLIGILEQLDNEFDDWAGEELPHVFGKIGPSAIEPLTRVATRDSQQEFIRSLAVRGLRQVADYHPETRDRIVASLTEMMASAASSPVEFNTILLVELVELRAVEAAEPIERAFAADLIDVGMMGDWETVRQELGVEGLRLPMPKKPHHSLEFLRQRMGIGIFSDIPLFSFGDVEHAAMQAYLQRASDTFSPSSEARQFTERHGNLGWFRTLLEYGLYDLREPVDEMTLASVKEFVFGYVPRKVSIEADEAAAIVAELTLFWEYLDRVYKLPAAKSIVEWLQSDGLVPRLKAELSDSSNFGMAKSIFMLGNKAGYDMTSEAGTAQFMAAYNERLLSHDAPATPISRGQRVGRNEPCPCGSGKKFKKCCGHPSRRG